MKRLHYFLALLVGIEATQVDVLFRSRGTIEYWRWVLESNDVRPFVYRVLVPYISQFLSYITTIDIYYCGIFVMAMSAVGFYICLVKIIGGEVRAFVGCQVLFVLTFLLTKVYDYTTAFMFALMILLMLRGKHGVYLALFPLATLNRETTFLATFFYVAYFYGKIPLSKLALNTLVQFVLFVGLKIIVQDTFSTHEGSVIFHSLSYMIKTYSNSLWSIPMIAIVYMIILQGWKAGEFIRVLTIAVFVPQALLHIYAGMPWEFRVLAETFPILVSALDTNFRMFVYQKSIQKVSL